MSTKAVSAPAAEWPKWALALDADRRTRGTPPSARAVPDPPGFGSKATKPAGKGKSQSQPPPRKPPTKEERDVLKLKKAWEIAISPAKQLPMKAIGMWMSPNSLQIFSIFMVFTLFKEPLAAIANIGPMFAKLETESTRDRMIWVKLVYVLCNLLVVGLGLYKVNKMGLLPTTRSDWLAWETSRLTSERVIPESIWDWASQS